jgi:general secretion pathway protein D
MKAERFFQFLIPVMFLLSGFIIDAADNELPDPVAPETAILAQREESAVREKKMEDAIEVVIPLDGMDAQISQTISGYYKTLEAISKDPAIVSSEKEKQKVEAFSKTLKALEASADKIDAMLANCEEKLVPLTSYNVEHLKIKVNEKGAVLKNKIARYITQFAEQSYAEEKFDKAIVITESAKKIFSDTVNQLGNLQKNIQIHSDRLEGLENAAGNAVERCASFKDKCEKEIAAADFDEKTSLQTIDLGRQARHADINAYMDKAVVLIKNQEYMKARDSLESILILDPYNMKATRMLKDLYEKLYQAGTNRRYNEYLETITANKWNWNEAVLPIPAEKPQAEDSTKQVDKTSIAAKLNDIILDGIDFDGVNINAAVEYISNESKKNDSSGTKTGIPIMLQLPEQQMQLVPAITMNLDSIPVGEVIRYICQATGLKYRIEEKAVIISSEITDVMETRFFKVRAAVINSIAPAAAEETTEMSSDANIVDMAGTFGDTATSTAPRTVTSEQLRAYFTERGIPFTATETSIDYNRRSGKLVATNSLENLRRLETLLREIDIETPLVLIEAKFVEITQTDLEDLGFEYLFSKDSGRGAVQGPESWWSVTQNASTMRTLGTNASGLLSPVDSTVNDRLINNLQWPASFGPHDRYNLNFYLHALDRSQYAEILSAPKVIARSGSEAIIRMVREEYFPESWTEPEITITSGIVSIVPSYPEFGEAKDLGIRFTVTPTVQSNHYTIKLSLHPEVLEHTGWTNYTYQIMIGGVTTTGTIRMPTISRRDVITNVKVYDGETLIIGGMIRDNVSSVDDRIPGFGDVPILGRLARTTNELSTKRNLIIFITARLVNPDGIPIRVGEMRGLFDFRR